MAETQTQPAEQPQLPLGTDPGQQQPSPDEALEPTTITLDGEDGATPEQAEKPQPSEEEVVVDSSPTLPDGQKPRRHVPSRQRIGQLTARAKTAEERAAALEAENQRLKQAGQQLYMQNQQNELQAMTQYGESLKAKIAGAKQKMTEARNSGDVHAEGEAIAEIGKLSADQSSVEAYLARNRQQRPQAPQQQRQEQQRPQQQEPQVTDEVKSWMKENSWYDRSSPDFDPEMNQFAFAESMKLDARYRRLGKENLIGSAAYLQEIDKAVRSEFPDEFESDGREQPPLRMEGKGPQAAVASSNAAQGIRRVGNETRVQLTSEERAFARQMQLKHEYGPKQGQPFTDQEKEVAYAKNKVALKNGKPPGGVEINMKIRG